jgi:hypothetical protein
MFPASSAHHQESGGCMYGEGLLMLSAWRSKHVEIENKNLSQVASVGLLIGIYEDARTRKHLITVYFSLIIW